MPDNSQMDPQGFSDSPHLRASDADRDRAATVINAALAEGRLTAEEHSERLDAIFSSKTNADLVPLLADLPSRGTAVAPAPAAGEIASGSGHSDKIVAILSGATRKGAWHVEPVIDILAVLGGAELDFRDAMLPGQEVTVRAVCVLGGVDITVPPEMHVVNSGVAILGGIDVTGDTGDSLTPDSPVLRITGMCLLGGITVKRKARKTCKKRRSAIEN
jgi:hypothetical protein